MACGSPPRPGPSGERANAQPGSAVAGGAPGAADVVLTQLLVWLRGRPREWPLGLQVRTVARAHAARHEDAVCSGSLHAPWRYSLCRQARGLPAELDKAGEPKLPRLRVSSTAVFYSTLAVGIHAIAGARIGEQRARRGCRLCTEAALEMVGAIIPRAISPLPAGARFAWPALGAAGAPDGGAGMPHGTAVTQWMFLGSAGGEASDCLTWPTAPGRWTYVARRSASFVKDHGAAEHALALLFPVLLEKEVQRLMHACGAVVAGGAAASALAAYEIPVGDVDIFVWGAPEAAIISAMLVDRGWRRQIADPARPAVTELRAPNDLRFEVVALRDFHMYDGESETSENGTDEGGSSAGGGPTSADADSDGDTTFAQREVGTVRPFLSIHFGAIAGFDMACVQVAYAFWKTRPEGTAADALGGSFFVTGNALAALATRSIYAVNTFLLQEARVQKYEDKGFAGWEREFAWQEAYQGDPVTMPSPGSPWEFVCGFSTRAQA